MTNEKAIGASSLPTIDRGTDARTKMSRKRFLSFIMVGILIVSAVSMIAPGLIGDNGQNDGNDQTAKISWNPVGKREAIYKVDHLFENYMKAANFTKAAHGNIQRIQERYLGHHSMTVMGNNDWLNTSTAASYRQTLYSEMTLRNNYPYIFYWNPVPSGKLLPTLPLGLATWAPFRITAVVKNDTAFRTGMTDKLGDGKLWTPAMNASADGRNVPFVPYWNKSLNGLPFNSRLQRGGYINVSLYGTYMTYNEVNALRNNLHYGNWFYGMPTTTTPLASTNDGYYFELHGTYQFSRNALITFLNWSGTGDARTWWNASKGVAQVSGIQKEWRDWLWENYSQTPAKGGGGGSGQPYWSNNSLQNGNIYTDYEFDMVGSAGLYVSMRMDPQSTNGTTRNSLALRVYMMGWGPDAALIRMLEQANITGSIGKSGSIGTPGFYNNQFSNRGGFANYGEDVYVNCSIRERMANSTWREVVTYTMIGWEDEANDVWTGGYMIPLGAHADYIPNIVGTSDTYPSPMNKYQLGGAGPNDLYTLDQTRSYNWNGPGAVLFNTNASVCLVAPLVRNLTKYEAIIVDLNILSSPWLSNVKDKYGGQTMAMGPYASASMTINAAKTAEFNMNLYWGTVKLGKVSYPTAAALAGYNAATKILNLSGGTTGMTMPLVFGTDYWGGPGHALTGQNSVLYTHLGYPGIQIDVAAVSSYKVEIQPGPHVTNTNYWVKVTPLNATGWIPRNCSSLAYGAGALIVNYTVQFSTNNVGSTWPTGLPAPAIGNTSSVTFAKTNGSRWTVVRFATANDAGHNSYVNVTDGMFTYIAAETQTGSTSNSIGPFKVSVPEFAAILIPIVGMMAMLFIFRSRKKKRGE